MEGLLTKDQQAKLADMKKKDAEKAAEEKRKQEELQKLKQEMEKERQEVEKKPEVEAVVESEALLAGQSEAPDSQMGISREACASKCSMRSTGEERKG